MPQTKADSELQPMFAGPAPFFANALLAVRAFFVEFFHLRLSIEFVKW